MSPSAAVAEAPLAQLLGDQREVCLGMKRLQARDDRGLGGGVDRRRLVAALACPKAGSRSTRVGSSSSTRLDRARRVAADREPIGHSSKGESRRPLVSFGKKYVLFCGMRSPARATASTWSTVGARTRKAAGASALRPRARLRSALAVNATSESASQSTSARVEGGAARPRRASASRRRRRRTKAGWSAADAGQRAEASAAPPGSR